MTTLNYIRTQATDFNRICVCVNDSCIVAFYRHRIVTIVFVAVVVAVEIYSIIIALFRLPHFETEFEIFMIKLHFICYGRIGHKFQTTNSPFRNIPLT